ncbi:MAG: hypothetical protein V3U78_02760 [Thiotrichaceae bacterium]
MEKRTKIKQPMPIFTRTYDMLVWVLQVTRHFPKMHRHDFTKRLLDAAFDLRERLEEANLRRVYWIRCWQD